MVPEIWSTTDRIFCHFGPLFALFPPKNPENQNVENIKKTRGDIITLHILFFILGYFLSLTGFPTVVVGGSNPLCSPILLIPPKMMHCPAPSPPFKKH